MTDVPYTPEDIENVPADDPDAPVAVPSPIEPGDADAQPTPTPM